MVESVGRIGVVSEELAGLNKSGGIGACALGLVLHLDSLGHEVHILITDMTTSSDDKLRFNKLYPNLSVTLLSDEVAEDKELNLSGDAISKAYAVYRYVSRLAPDVVHFNDWLGSGFYCAMARRQGSLQAKIVSHLHGSSEWVRRFNRHLPSLEDFELEAIEKSQVENSDLVVSPSQYLLDWYTEQGVTLPEARVVNWLLPQWLSPGSDHSNVLQTPSIEAGSIDTLIFFGRHERRKGFELFLDAVLRFPEDFHPDIVFVGRFDKIDREFSGSLALRRLKDYGGEIHFVNDLGQREALNFLKRRKRSLCVIPSLIENSPCVVGECFTIGIPFVCTNVGGIAELFGDANAPSLSRPDSNSLASTILNAHRQGLPSIVSSLNCEKIMEEWRRLHAALILRPSESVIQLSEPLVTVCVTHHERPKFLELALTHLNSQTYRNIEIVIVDDGSVSVQAVSALARIEEREWRFPVRVVRTANNYLGAARNAGAKVANGEYILFHDDDNVAEPHEVECFVSSAINSKADVLTCQSYVFRANDARGPFSNPQKTRSIEFFPIGIGGIFSFFRNRFGDANALVKKDVFDEIGGFTELRGVGVEDWEFFLKAHIKGFKTGIVPSPLFHYRVSANGMLATGDFLMSQERINSAVDSTKPALVGDLLRFAHRQELAQAVLDRTWYRLGKEHGGNLHHELVALDPNSDAARRLLSDLAFELGRVKDAVHLALPIYDQREKILALSKVLRRDGLRNCYQSSSVTISSGATVHGYFLRGWFIDKEGNPREPAGFVIANEEFTLISSIRYDRPDVRDALDLPSATALGLTAIVRKTGSVKLLERLGGMARQRIKVSRLGDVTLTKKSRRLRGSVDEAVGFSSINIAVPSDIEWSGKIEILAADNIKAAINWGAGEFDFGSIYSNNRITFMAPDDGVKRSEIEICLSSEKVVDVIFR